MRLSLRPEGLQHTSDSSSYQSLYLFSAIGVSSVVEYKVNADDLKHEMRLLESSAPGICEELESIGFLSGLMCSHHVNLVNNIKYQVIDGTSQYVVYLPTKRSNKSIMRSSIMANT
uniref:Uncharacterized protein n=1 Tax=Cucumis melo TaxID=3656 RepID=A0A9I9EGJ0_CUCME